MREVQALHKKIIENPAYKTSLDEIKAAFEIYEKVFRGLEIIE